MKHYRLFILAVLLMSSVSLQGNTASSKMQSIPTGFYQPFYQELNKEKQRIEKIKVDAFYLDEHLVTNEDYLSFIEAKPKWKKSKAKKIFVDENYLADWLSDLKFDQSITKSPVRYVSWFAANAYCQWQGKRLPTMDEWEYVAQADEEERVATKKEAFKKRILAWYGRPTAKQLSAVGSLSKNVYGISDMHGLVWEWVLDFNSVLLTGESRGDGGVERKLYCAGGAVGVEDVEDYAAFMRYAFRASLQARYTVAT